ncbi:MAG: cytidylyltransferase domain-containing protein [Bacteroidota bacterium]
MSSIAVLIPARGGSKRLPGKNLLPLAGMPLINHSINYALSFKELFNGVFVSTDDDQIAQVASKAGAEVIKRPTEFATDSATSASVANHALSFLPKTTNSIVLLQPTNPLRPSGMMEVLLDAYQIGSFDSMFTISPLHKKAGHIQEERFVPVNYHFGQRSQETEQLYFENGLAYISSVDVIRQNKIIGDQHGTLVVDHVYGGVDIDTMEDFEYATYLFEKHRSQ